MHKFKLFASGWISFSYLKKYIERPIINRISKTIIPLLMMVKELLSVGKLILINGLIDFNIYCIDSILCSISKPTFQK